MLKTIAAFAVALSGLFYIWLGFRHFRVAKDITDHVPLAATGNAAVKTPSEFGAATVATTVSLTTMILAFFELAGYFGPWLLWTAVTTASGLGLVRFLAPLIWKRFDRSRGELLTLHAHLGSNFASPALCITAALCTTLGFLGALAIELTVGSRFLAEIAGFNAILTVIALSAIAVFYTVLGGFRVVIETDRWQMIAIWVAIIALGVLSFIVMERRGGVEIALSGTAPELTTFSWREGLGIFLLGIFLLNVPTFLADMSVWQRIAATRDEATLKRGLARSILGAFSSWTLLVILACVITSLVPVGGQANVLSQFLSQAGGIGGPVMAVCLFVIIVGLYAASLSTASTQLVAAAQTVQQDLLERGSPSRLYDGLKRLRVARLLVLALGLGSIFIVEVLRVAGFSITDLVFAIFGSQLGMVPAVLLSLLGRPEHNRARGSIVAIGVAAGFVAGWATAIYGNAIGNGNLVFLAPVASIATSSVFSVIAIIIGRRT